MKFRNLFVVAVLALITTGVYAGSASPVAVEVDLDNGFAQGDMVTSRYSSDKNEFIGCGSRHFDDGVFSLRFGFCQAKDQDGDQAVCFTENPDLLDRIDGISDFSFLTFGWIDDGFGGFECVRIGFSTQSFYLPRGINANGNNGNGNGGE